MDEGTLISHWYESCQTTETESNILVRNRIHALVTLCQQQHRVTVRSWGVKFRMGLPQTPVDLEPPKSEAWSCQKTVTFALLCNVFYFVSIFPEGHFIHSRDNSLVLFNGYVFSDSGSFAFGGTLIRGPVSLKKTLAWYSWPTSVPGTRLLPPISESRQTLPLMCIINELLSLLGKS